MKKGFTLIELLVTISIISVLMGLMLVAFNGTKSTARDGRRKADLIAIGSALELYRQDNGKYPVASGWQATLTSGGYMNTSVPADPMVTQQYTYSPTLTGYYLCAKLELGAGVTTNCANCGSGITCNYQVLNP